MAMGADTMFAQSVLALKKEFPKVQLEAAVPCRGQENSWQEADRALYRSLLLKCDTVTYVSENYSPGCMQKRNRYMADKSSLLIALSFGDKGGTENTIKYAARRGLEIIRL